MRITFLMFKGVYVLIRNTESSFIVFVYLKPSYSVSLEYTHSFIESIHGNCIGNPAFLLRTEILKRYLQSFYLRLKVFFKELGVRWSYFESKSGISV